MSNSYHSYLNFLDKARQSHSPHYNTNQVAELLKKMNTNHALFSGSNKPVVFLLDMLEQKYLSMSSSVFSISGYTPRYMMDGGVEMAMAKYHPVDGQIYFENIFFKNLEILQRLPTNQHADYCFTYNYRFKTRPGEYRNILQKLAIIQSAADGTPLLMLVLATDITHFKTDSKVLHTIEQLNESKAKIIYSKTHFTEEQQRQLSIKEIEILKWVTDGMSSKEIADKLHLSIYTVHNHRKHILEKTNCGNTAELLLYAIDQHYI